MRIEVQAGERLVVIGKKGQGTSSFVNMLIGSMKKIEGSIFMCG